MCHRQPCKRATSEQARKGSGETTMTRGAEVRSNSSPPDCKQQLRAMIPTVVFEFARRAAVDAWMGAVEVVVVILSRTTEWCDQQSR